MATYAAIYGFEVTKRIDLPNVVIHPRYRDNQSAKILASDKKCFHLTAVGELDTQKAADLLFDLAGALTFCEQQWVLVSHPHVFSTLEEALAYFPRRHECNFVRQTTGGLLQADSFDKIGKKNLLARCLKRLGDVTFLDTEGSFRAAFFRHVDTWRQFTDYTDVTYYLDFSALEILARAHFRDYLTPVALLLRQFLNHHGFDEFVQDDPSNRLCSTQTYAHLRNALFHNGKYEKQLKINSSVTITLLLTDFEDHFRLLVPDVILKVIGYSNSTINWGRWRDRMPFIA